MNVKEFLDLPKEQRELLVELHEKQKRVREQWDQIRFDEAKLFNRKFNLQHTGCEHPMATKVANSDKGNYDPSQDSSWYDCKCPDCGKTWVEDQ